MRNDSVHQVFCYFLLGFIINLFINFKFLYAQSWPTLYTQEDIIPQKKSDLKEIEKIKTKNISKIPENKIREKIFNSYYFILDFVSSTKGELPKNWIDSQKEPEKSLIYGFPPELKRPSVPIYFPAFNLTKLAFFISDDPYISRLNMCQDFWIQNRLQKSYDCFFFLQMDLAKDNVPISSLIRLQTNILQAFLFLHLATNDVNNLYIWNAKIVPPSPQEFTEGDHYAMARVLFSYIATKVDDSTYLPTKKNASVINEIYDNIYDSPVYFKVTTKIAGKKTSITHLQEPIDSIKWIQTVMPLVYYNSMVMNQGVMIWDRAFTSAWKLENYYARFDYPKMPEGSPLVVESPSKVTSPIFIAPRNNTDILSSADLFRSLAMLIGKDPGKAFEHTSSGIFRKAHPELTALHFHVTGNTYFDLDLLRWARRSYSWAELYSKSFSEKVPSNLIYGAESAFWAGQYEVAKNAYIQFLTIAGDKVYSPWANLRLAEIEELNGNQTFAKNKYEQILRNFDMHPVADEAQVRLFCLYEKNLTKNAKMVEYNKVLERIKTARDVLKKQAKTCMLRADLTKMQEESFKDNKASVEEKSNKQIEAINNFAKEFPNNEFMVLFTDRIKELELFKAPLFAEHNKCTQLIDFFVKNRDSLNKLSLNNHHFIGGLKWDNADRLKVLRCAAFAGNIDVWKEMRSHEVGKDGVPLHSTFYNLSLKPSVSNALKAYMQLKNTSSLWINKVKKIEKSSFEVIDRDDFWEMLTLRELLKYNLTMSESAQSLIDNAVAVDMFANPKLIYSSDTFCFWMLKASRQFNTANWESIAKTKTKNEWTLLLTDEKIQKNQPCEASFAKKLNTHALTNSSVFLDTYILLPFLEKVGVADASEDWLRYVQRIEKNLGSNNPEIINIYKNLLDKSKSALVKEASRLWIQKNIPSESEKLLW